MIRPLGVPQSPPSVNDLPPRLNTFMFPPLAQHPEIQKCGKEANILVVACMDCAMTMLSGSPTARLCPVTLHILCADCAVNRQEQH